MNLDYFIDTGIFLCNCYGQDSVLIYDPRTAKPCYFNKAGDIISTFNGKVINDMESIYYTCFQKSTKGKNGRYNGKNWRFTYVEKSTSRLRRNSMTLKEYLEMR